MALVVSGPTAYADRGRSRPREAIVRVRARRPRPGLQRQHLTAVKAASQLSGAQVEGAVIGSQEIIFALGPRRSCEWELDVGTACRRDRVRRGTPPSLTPV
jgi:RNA 3'-terminal phosphate cyclase (ATP)